MIQMMMRTADCQTMVELAPFGLMVVVAAFEHVEVDFHRLIEPGFHIQHVIWSSDQPTLRPFSTPI